MQFYRTRVYIGSAMTVIAALAFFSSTLQAQDFLQRAKNFKRDIKQKLRFKHAQPETGCDDAIETLADQIDWLENYMDQNGSIVAKHPDIWGESRLTKFRREIEEQLEDRMDDFEVRDNARIIRSDIANLAAALSIGAAASTPAPAPGTTATTTTVATPAAPDLSEVTTVRTLTPLATENPLTAASSLEPVVEVNQLNRYLNHLTQLRRINEGDDTSDAPGYALNLVRIPVSILPGRATRRGYGAEVTISTNPYNSKNLLPSTFRNLVVNDLVDQLSLPVVRLAEIPSEVKNVSRFLNRPDNVAIQNGLATQLAVLQSKSNHTDLDFANFVQGAIPGSGSVEEDWAQIDRYAVEFINLMRSNGQLPIAIQTLEAHALLGEQIITYVRQSKLRLSAPELATEQRRYLGYVRRRAGEQAVEQNEELRQANTRVETLNEALDEAKMKRETAHEDLRVLSEEVKALEGEIETLTKARDQAQEPSEVKGLQAQIDEQAEALTLARSRYSIQRRETDNLVLKVVSLDQKVAQAPAIMLERRLPAVSGVVSGIANRFAAIRIPQINIGSGFAMSKPKRVAVPPQIIEQVYGREVLDAIAAKLRLNYTGRHTVWNNSSAYPNQVHLADGQRFLQAKFGAAYDALATESGCQMLTQVIENGQLAQLIQIGNLPAIENLRNQFINDLETSRVNTDIACYCWCVAVEMASLNKRLNEDVRETAIARGDCKCDSSKYCKFYLPSINTKSGTGDYTGQFDPDFQEAANQFCDYVNCRWPIHVFTIDPVNQEQNVSDASTVQRELTIATALAFAAGNINSSQLARFQRQYQEQISTVSLNRTQVGFAHGNDTFGWRFSPRIQTRKSQGNVRAFGETLFGRNADTNIREASLEPGMRECTAIVLMPSFVPYCDFDIRTNWYRLDKPSHSDVSMKETLKLSRSVTAMRKSKHACLACESAYRDGEVDRLLRRVEQLEREIPLQSLRAQIPYENTLGGFDLFNNGLTDLAPTLIGWYGAPGIRLRGTTSSASAAMPAAAATSTPVTNIMVTVNNEVQEAQASTSAAAATTSTPSTTLFLVGDNFSVHETRVVAGGIPIDNPTLISRQVMQIAIPETANTVTIQENGQPRTFVAVYAATPYGVTSHMHIPIIRNPAAQATTDLAALQQRVARLEVPEFQWQNNPSISIEVGFARDGGVCSATGIEPVNSASRLTLAANSIAANGIDQKKFRLRGRLLNAAGSETVGTPFTIVDSTDMTDGIAFMGSSANIPIANLFEGSGLRTELAKIRSTQFNGQNNLTLRLETYIQFKESMETYERSIRVGGNITLQLIAVSCNSAGSSAMPSRMTTDGAESNPVNEAEVAPLLNPSEGSSKKESAPNGSLNRRAAPYRFSSRRSVRFNNSNQTNTTSPTTPLLITR